MSALGSTFSDLKKVVSEGEKIYAEKYKQQFETRYADHFAAVEVTTGKAFVGQFPEMAVQKAREQVKGAVVHLIRIGSPSAYHVSFFFAAPDADLERVL